MNPRQKITVVGITGGIGAGKSVVSRLLRCKGFEVYDCDLEARRIMENSHELKCEIFSTFGPECIRKDGSLARDVIAGHVFGDDGKRLWLNSRVHALVRLDIESRIETRSSSMDLDDQCRLFFIESAILNTGRLTPYCSSVWLIEASGETRIRRVSMRDGADREKIVARMKSQEDEFSSFGDLPVEIICNDDDSPLLGVIDKRLIKLLS